MGGVSGFLDFGRELVVDLFAGGGGASLGLGRAYREPDVAINHSPVAVSVHQANHPNTQHFTCDVFEVDPVTATGGRQVGVLWASPDCRHHSKAAGRAPRSKKVRALAWVVVKWAKAVRPRVIMLENVEEFQDWGPLAADGSPCPDRKGSTFREWVGELRALGYAVEWRELVAADYGAPTIRKRLYLIARCDGLPIRWPVPTHDRTQWRAAHECIDWSIPAQSIFERKRPLVDNTCRRIARGAWRYVLNTDKPFVVGGVAPYLTEHANGSGQRVFSAQEPLRTQVANIKGGHFALACAYFEQANGGFYDGDGRDAREPLSTICTSGANQRLVTAYFEQIKNWRKNEKSGRRDAAYPGGASSSPRGRIDLESDHARPSRRRQKDYAEAGRKEDEERLPGREGSQAEPSVHGVCASPRVWSHGGKDSRGDGYQSLGREQGKQRPNQSRSGNPLGESPPRVPDRASSSHTTVAYLTKYYGNEREGVSLREPLHTVTTKDRMGLIQCVQIPADALTPEQREKAMRCADFLHKYLPEHFPEPFDAVLVGDLVLVDFTLRMLAPRELARAQGFPDSYVLERGAMGESITKTDQVRLIGNSVCPDVARALAGANLVELIDFYEMAEAA